MGAGLSQVNKFEVVSGHYSVGSGDVMVRGKDLTGKQNEHGSFFRLFYPTPYAKIKEDHTPLSWIPREEYLDGFADVFGMNETVFHYITRFTIGHAHTLIAPVHWHPPLAKLPEHLQATGYPIVIFSHGLCGMRTISSSICADIASHGFIVAALEHRDGSACRTYFPNEEGSIEGEATKEGFSWLKFKRFPIGDTHFEERNAQLQKRVSDVECAVEILRQINDTGTIASVEDSQFDLGQFRGQMDFSRLAIAGHSFGGATTIASFAKFHNIKVAVSLDPWTFPLGGSEAITGLADRPIMHINTDYFQYKDNVERLLNLMKEHKEQILITILGSVHANQTDMPFLFPSGLPARYFRSIGDIDSLLCHNINNELILAFFRKHLDLPGEKSVENLLIKYEAHLRKGPSDRYLQRFPAKFL